MIDRISWDVTLGGYREVDAEEMAELTGRGWVLIAVLSATEIHQGQRGVVCAGRLNGMCEHGHSGAHDHWEDVPPVPMQVPRYLVAEPLESALASARETSDRALQLQVDAKIRAEGYAEEVRRLEEEVGKMQDEARHANEDCQIEMRRRQELVEKAHDMEIALGEARSTIGDLKRKLADKVLGQ